MNPHAVFPPHRLPFETGRSAWRQLPGFDPLRESLAIGGVLSAALAGCSLGLWSLLRLAAETLIRASARHPPSRLSRGRSGRVRRLGVSIGPGFTRSARPPVTEDADPGSLLQGFSPAQSRSFEPCIRRAMD